MDPIFFSEERLGSNPLTATADVARWYRKANALASAWKKTFDEEICLNATVLCLAVAQLETRCGDVWPGVHNWGAVQGRVPTEAECRVLAEAGLKPHPSNVQAGQAALEAAVKAGRIQPNPTGSLQCDSSPKKGYYWVFFLAFPDDIAGATKFVRVLAVNRPNCRVVLESPEAPGREHELAAAMYASHYYEGTHDPDEPGGKDANINLYTSAIRSWTSTIRRSLASWSPDATVPDVAPIPDTLRPGTLSTVEVQRALNKLGVKPSLKEDGVAGPVTRAAIKAFQVTAGLVPDGVAGPVTCAALEAALKK